MTTATQPIDAPAEHVGSTFGEGLAPRRLTPGLLRIMMASGPDVPAIITPDGRVFWADGKPGTRCGRFTLVRSCGCRLESDGPGQPCAEHAGLADWPRELYEGRLP